MQLLTDSFIKKYPEAPTHMNELSSFVYYRTYSRYLPKMKRHENWKETVRRAVEYNVGLSAKHLKKIGFSVEMESLRKEAEELFDSMFHLRQFLSGRTMWIGGAESGVAEKYPLANFNCAFLNITKWDDIGDLFYLLMVGSGVGFKCTQEMARNMPPIRNHVKLEHLEYQPIAKHQRFEETQLVIQPNGIAKMDIGDSKEGWTQGLKTYFEVLTHPKYDPIHTIQISYNSVRPKGERLKTFGGTSSGYDSFREMLIGIDKVLRNQIDAHLHPLEPVGNGYVRVRPIHILDIGNIVGNNVVAGGVRRTAEIFLFEPDDYESMFAKYGINGLWSEQQFQQHEKMGRILDRLTVPKPGWWEEIGKRNYEGRINGTSPFNYGRPIHHRRVSNNSIVFDKKPPRERLNLAFEMMQMEGEPGFINLEEAQRRRPNAEGFNPCAEILLDSYGVCNLTTLNMVAFVKKGQLDIKGLIEAQKRSVRAGLRMTLADLELPHWDSIQKRDRLLGPSLTGVKDAFALCEDLQNEARILAQLKKVARQEADRYAKELRVTSPLLVTTIKPEGTLSQVAGGVSSGLHWSHSPYYIRRIRINASDPLAQVALALGWTVHPDIGTPGETHEEQMKNARTLVIDFPVASGAVETKEDVSAVRQLDSYFCFQKNYTEHNSSNTITVRLHEWGDVERVIWDRWNEFTAVSFLAQDGGTYQLAPYEAITKEQYEAIKAKMKPFDASLLLKYATGEDFDLGNDGCHSGNCPVR
ncbi:ribonucleoside-triphosphate reductase, adenosylcobalamin-dependent [Marininema halotolerans]|uniref:Adenosylcobalamin-dependent ribonucleoside-triphosphate reductase n=1 Tax=Marininema halotolerans TaxID=1155944 RepID=A0A1I6RYZ3_9BACL|nr:ribonucleoside-triphosphate reductase, adenosylcobalamin-dependent [Marininema halotolerans]SFS69912.1 ribonucleoside-diphosphate reductase alpha chain/ribonucleoside-triphosphate reductase [Marininema halotolerans]